MPVRILSALLVIWLLPAAAEPIKVVVDSSNEAAIASLYRQGGSLVADRGHYQVLLLSHLTAISLDVQGVTRRDDFDTIRLRRQHLDTRQGPIPAPRVLSAPNRPRRLKLVQFRAPPSDDDLLKNDTL